MTKQKPITAEELNAAQSRIDARNAEKNRARDARLNAIEAEKSAQRRRNESMILAALPHCYAQAAAALESLAHMVANSDGEDAPHKAQIAGALRFAADALGHDSGKLDSTLVYGAARGGEFGRLTRRNFNGMIPAPILTAAREYLGYLKTRALDDDAPRDALGAPLAAALAEILK